MGNVAIETLTDDQIHQYLDRLCEVSALAFGHDPSNQAMRVDTIDHILSAGERQVAVIEGTPVGFALYRRLGNTIILAGRVVRPDFQSRGIGLSMLKERLAKIEANPAHYIATQTRNPAVLEMICRASGGDVYPLVYDEELAAVAAAMPGAELTDKVAYEPRRYGEQGLYGPNVVDPAEKTVEGFGRLKDAFPSLQDPRAALIVVARIQNQGV